MNIRNIINETIHTLGDSLDAFKHHVMMYKLVLYRMHFQYHKHHNSDYSDFE